MNVQEPGSDWISPLDSHPAAISRVELIGSWIDRAYKNVDRAIMSGCAVLYNISLQTFEGDTFRKLWVRHCGPAAQDDLGDPYPKGAIDKLHLILPYHIGDEESEENCLGRGVNGQQLFDFVAALAGNRRLQRDAEPVLRKIWVSFVPTPRERTGEDDADGDYAFAVYLAIPKEARDDVDTLLVRNAQNDSVARNQLSSYTQLILAAGLTEPFSRRDSKGYLKYRFILPIADRDTAGIPPTECAITEHIQLLGHLWAKRESPLDLCSCHEIYPMMAHECVGSNCIRMDAFLGWAVAALDRTDRMERSRMFSISTGPISLRK